MSEEIDENRELEITAKMPAWMRQYLAIEGFHKVFTIAELTGHQKDCLTTANALSDLEKKGLVSIKYDPKTDMCPYVGLTAKGVDRAKKLDRS